MNNNSGVYCFNGAMDIDSFHCSMDFFDEEVQEEGLQQEPTISVMRGVNTNKPKPIVLKTQKLTKPAVAKASKPVISKISKPINTKKIKTELVQKASAARDEEHMYNLIMNAIVKPGDMFETVEELLNAYPKLRFKENCDQSLFWWHDIAKAASPKGEKNELRYNREIFKPLIEQAYQQALDTRNLMKKALSVVKASGNKKALLKVLSRIENLAEPYTTGGDPRPATRRVVMFYEQEGNVKAKKRKTAGAAAVEEQEHEEEEEEEVVKHEAPHSPDTVIFSEFGSTAMEDAPSPRNKKAKLVHEFSAAAVPIVVIPSTVDLPDTLSMQKYNSNSYQVVSHVAQAIERHAMSALQLAPSSIDSDIVNFFSNSVDGAEEGGAAEVSLDEWDGVSDFFDQYEEPFIAVC